MTVEELMQPRYKVIADWPFRKNFEVGEIVILNKEFSPNYKMYEVKDCQGLQVYITSFFEKFPLQFKKLEWWEDRKVEDMPEYIIGRKRGEGVYLKVDKWFFDEVCGYWQTIKDDFTFSCPYATPIAEQEYLNYINQSK